MGHQEGEMMVVWRSLLMVGVTKDLLVSFKLFALASKIAGDAILSSLFIS